MQQGVTPDFLQQVECLPSGIHCTTKLLVPEQADNTAHGGMYQANTTFLVYIPQLCVRLHAYSATILASHTSWILSDTFHKCTMHVRLLCARAEIC